MLTSPPQPPFFTHGICVSHSVMSNSATPWIVVNQASLWNSPGKNTRVSSHSLLQGSFLAQGSNPGLLHCRQNLSNQGSPQNKTKFPKGKLIDTENRLVVARGGGWGWEKWVKGIKR